MEDNNEKKQTWKTVTKTDMEDDNEIMDMEDNENDKKKTDMEDNNEKMDMHDINDKKKWKEITKITDMEDNNKKNRHEKQ